MTPEELDAIKARCEAATKGPWSQITGMLAYTPKIIATIGSECYIVQNDVAGPGIANDTQPDLAFIAHAREDVPALVAEVERLRALLVRAQPYLKKCGDDHDKSKSRLEAEIRTALEGK